MVANFLKGPFQIFLKHTLVFALVWWNTVELDNILGIFGQSFGDICGFVMCSGEGLGWRIIWKSVET